MATRDVCDVEMVSERSFYFSLSLSSHPRCSLFLSLCLRVYLVTIKATTQLRQSFQVSEEKGGFGVRARRDWRS